MNIRPTFDAVFLEMARTVAKRATCPRAHVGCVIAVGNHMVSSGYNGSLPGADHCTDAGCHVVETHTGERCIRTVHAEANAVASAAGRGISIATGTAYLTRLPCPNCLKLLAAAGIVRIVCDQVLKDKYIEGCEWFAKEARIVLEYPGREQ